MNLYFVKLTYKVDFERVMQSAPAHREWLGKFYASERILFSGVQLSKTGGAIMMKAQDEAQVNELIHGDPFFTEGLADYEVVGFEARKAQPYVQQWIDAD